MEGKFGRKKVWRINRSANRLLMISTNLDDFNLANHGRFAKFAKVSLHTVYYIYIYIYIYIYNSYDSNSAMYF